MIEEIKKQSQKLLEDEFFVKRIRKLRKKNIIRRIVIEEEERKSRGNTPVIHNLNSPNLFDRK